MGVIPKTAATRDKENVPAYQMKLERVLGLTVTSNSTLHCDPNSELVAYSAGCTVVLLDSVSGLQSHIINTSKKTITCVKFSKDGRYLATGECGQSPSLRVWDLQENTLLMEIPGHKHSINCLAFSPNQKYLVSDSQHDMVVNVWDWRSGVKVASNKVSTKVKAISFAENGSYFVTVGNRLVKFWYLDHARPSKYKEPIPVMGRSAILGDQRNNDFVDVACGRGEMADSTYAITRSGLLCEFNIRRLLDKWVELRTTSANCLSIGEHRIFIGCADGIVRCFHPRTLQFITTLPRTHYLGVDVAQGLDISHMASIPNNAKYPDTIAITFDEPNNKLTCVYNDRSLYVWDVRDIMRVGKSHSFLYHSACIWGVEMFPPGSHNLIPPGSFATCSSDDTIRVWNIDGNVRTLQDSLYQRNIYSKELLKVMYFDSELASLKEVSETDAACDGRNGVRTLRVSPDGKHLASGDRAGNIRVHDIESLEEVCLIEAHDAEVLCLEYSKNNSAKRRLLASASRDRLVHVFDVDQGYNFVQTLDDHSSSITSVRFINNSNQLQMVSCGADKSIIFRQLTPMPDGPAQFTRVYNAAGKTTLYDMEVDYSQKHVLTACQDRNIRVYNVVNGKHSKTFKGSIGEDGTLIKVTLDPSGIFVATSCTDKTLCLYDYYSGECKATMTGHSELVTGLRFTNDCTRLVSASGDGCVHVWAVPHDMVVTMQARLAQQAARLREPNRLTNGIHSDDEENTPDEIQNQNNANAGLDLSFSRLPLWAKREFDGLDLGGSSVKVSPSPPKGRWAQRFDKSAFTFKSVYENECFTLSSTTGKEKSHDSDKEDSSVDSGAETGRSLPSGSKRDTPQKSSRDSSMDFLSCSESLQEITNGEPKPLHGGKVTITRGGGSEHRPQTDDSSLGSYKCEDMESTEHDGDVEDYSEGESSDTRRPLYIPSHDDTKEYPVTNIDAGELRKSVRRAKQRPDLLMVTGEMSSASRSMSGSQSEEDETATTPTSDHNTLSASSETLNYIVHREKFLKDNFESLSGAEDTRHIKGKRSLSSKYHGGLLGGVRNSSIIEAAKNSRNDAEVLRIREELQRRMAETKRKLQSVGYKSPLKASQSIQDLSMRGSPLTPKPSPRHRTLHQGNDGCQRQPIDTRTFTRKPKPTNTSYANNINTPNGRPVSLNLSHLTSPGYFPYIPGCKSLETSLDTSPVSPTRGFKSYDVGMRMAAKEAQMIKRYSCSFYININESKLESYKESKSLDDLNEFVHGKPVELLDKPEDKSGSDYSSDSLEECVGMKPRRCISEYQILQRSSSVTGFKGYNEQRSQSEENILDDHWERHSSASFFLTKKEAARSTESILTDESEYQFLFSNKDVFKSTESMLSDVEDNKEFPEEELNSLSPRKKAVVRTRSLQDTSGRALNVPQGSKSRPETPFSLPKEISFESEEASLAKTKNESFFVAIGEGPKKLGVPESLIKRQQTREEKKTAQCPGSPGHPLVAHKPPKPKPSPARKSPMTTPKKTPRPPEGFRDEEVKKEPLEEVKEDTFETPPKPEGRVKLLSRNFERISGSNRDEVSPESGSSTPGTQSSSAANSPKRHRHRSISYHLVRRVSPAQLLPSKCQPEAVESEFNGGIRRSISLSDLTSPAPPKTKGPMQGSGKTSYGVSNVPKGLSVAPSRLPRSSSVGVLNQSDSESEGSMISGQKSLMSLRLMRPTIASQNKMVAGSKQSSARRARISNAYSSINLSMAGNTEDSSSEENQSVPKTTKPVPPPRPKSANFERAAGMRRAALSRNGSDRERGSKGLQRSGSGLLRSEKSRDPVECSNPAVSGQLISSMDDQLNKAGATVAELQAKLRDPNLTDEERTTLVGNLSAAITELQKTFQLMKPTELPSSNPSSSDAQLV